MVGDLIEVIRETVRHELRRHRVAELAIVESIYELAAGQTEESYGCDVRLRDTGVRLGRVPVATGYIGTAALPCEGDLVLVVFARGDLHQPIVVGRLYCDAQGPPACARHQMVLRTPMEEKDDAATVTAMIGPDGDGRTRIAVLRIPEDVTVEADAGTLRAQVRDATLELSCKDGVRARLAVKGTEIEIADDGSITINAEAGITVSAQGDIAIDAGGRLTLSGGGGIVLDGAASTELSAARVSIKGMTEFSM